MPSLSSPSAFDSSTHKCLSYCNISGYYSDGFSCGDRFCCGSSNVRYCCNNATLDISNNYQEKCRCPMSSCTQLSWDILLPCIAAGVFVFLMITICCCQSCKNGGRCRQFLRRRCMTSQDAGSTDGRSGGSLGDGNVFGSISGFPNLPPYEFGPPKYESLELTESPPKYEEIMSEGQQHDYLNCAFVGDSNTPERSTVTPDCTAVTPGCTAVTPGCTGIPRHASQEERVGARTDEVYRHDNGGSTPDQSRPESQQPTLQHNIIPGNDNTTDRETPSSRHPITSQETGSLRDDLILRVPALFRDQVALGVNDSQSRRDHEHEHCNV